MAMSTYQKGRFRSRLVLTGVSLVYPNLLGSSPQNPAISARQIMEQRPEAKNGYYWIKTKYMSNPVFIYCNFTWHGGGWMRLNSIIATASSEKGSSPIWYTGDPGWDDDLVYGQNKPSNCGVTTSVITVTCTVLDYTEAICLLQRGTTVIQCASFTGKTSSGWYTKSGVIYPGTYTEFSTCQWNDGIWANSGTPIGSCKPNWVFFCTVANQTPIKMVSQCSDASDNGYYYNYYYVR